MTLADPVFTAWRVRIVRLAAATRLPGIYYWKDFVDAGGLSSYGPSLHALYRRAALYVDKILKGAHPPTCLSSRPRSSSCPSTSSPPRPSA
jgi:putative ABC transport system substrate-binding protein